MIEWINSWVQGIIIAVIITTIIEMILPDNNIKKYIRTTIGVYMIFIIISPIIMLITGKTININEESIIDKYTSNNTTKTVETINTNKYIESTYIDKIKEDIIEKINNKGYMVKDLNVQIETENEDTYGEILNIKFGIYKRKVKQNETNEVKTVNQININITNNTKETSEEITEKEKEELKEYLKSIYYTEQIEIYNI